MTRVGWSGAEAGPISGVSRDGSSAAPSGVKALAGRAGPSSPLAVGRIMHASPSTTTSAAAGHAEQAAPGVSECGGWLHPWHGRRFSGGWGHVDLDVTPVEPQLVVEFLADTSVDDGRW